MKNREVWDSYDFYTGEVTKHARYLGFVGVAVCWFFRTEQITFPNLILSSLAFLITFFILDLTQYYISAMKIRKWMQCAETKQKNEAGAIDGEYWPPSDLDAPAFRLFKLKLLFLLVGFFCIGLELLVRLLKT